MKIKVNQKDLNGNIINSYESYAHAASVLGCNESTIRRASKVPNRAVFGKFKFEVDNNTTQLEVEKTPDSPRILLLDIETSLILAHVFQKQVWKARIGHSQIVSDYYMLTWSAKWLGNDYIYSDRLTPEEVYEEDDSRIAANLWLLLDEADMVCGHNLDAFDIPNIFTRFVQHNYPPPSSFRQIDTLKIAQRYFGFTHNSLDALAKFFKLEGKIETGLELWKACIRGDKKALEDMETYNKQDVRILENIFYKLRPYAKGLPNLNVYTNDDAEHCPTCGNKDIKKIENKFFYTQSAKYDTYRCSKCGGISRSKKAVLLDNKIKLTAIPK